MRFLGTYLLYGENELLEVGAQSESIRFSGSPRRNGPAAPSNLSPVHKSCPTPTLKVLPHNHLPVSSLASRERRSAYCRRTFQVFAFNAHARLTTYLKRGCVWPDFLEWKNRRIFLFMVGTDNPLYQNVQVYCCLSSAFSADVTYKKITSPVLSILFCGI